tara:strand:+ start:523 stop:1026 length:504 start_codon:yes stop_codon:yes gene_type:complete
MTITLNGTTGVTTPGVTSTGTMSSTGVITASQGVGGTPAFSAILSANQSLTASTFTKLNFNTEEFDTNSNYDTTNYRFTPTVAGYYQVSAAIYPNTTVTAIINYIYKNGATYKGSAGTSTSAVATCLVYMNGSTDYIESYGYCTGTTPVVLASSSVTYFQAVLVRSA